MKVVFFGHNGWIGSQIVKEWTRQHPEDELILSTIRVEEQYKAELEREIKGADRVVCTIGRTSGVVDGVLINNIDYLETHLELNLRDNLYGPLLLALICSRYNIHLTYLGTGCIFSRNTRNNDYLYTEEDEPDFFGSAYSTVKGKTDSLMKILPNVLNLRIRMPITADWNSKNFLTKIIGFKKICSYPNSMTYLPNFVPIIVAMTKTKTRGTFNMVNPGEIDHNKILEKVKQRDPSHSFELIEQSDLSGLLKAKRSNNLLATGKLEQWCREFNCQVRAIEECIDEAVDEMYSDN
jgi:3,5-epimerase/4-reductase